MKFIAIAIVAFLIGCGAHASDNWRDKYQKADDNIYVTHLDDGTRCAVLFVGYASLGGISCDWKQK
jgi:hypothetical protein